MPRVDPAEKKGCMGWVVLGLAAVVALAIWTWLGHGPLAQGIEKARVMEGISQVNAIVQAMDAYAKDHGGAYPEGNTSTEVFQKLLDGRYVSDPKIFFVLTGGKYPAASSQLDARNVCFDVTGGATAKSPDDLPLVFTSGFNVKYAPGVNATHATDIVGIVHGMAICAKDGRAHFQRETADGSVPDFFPAAAVTKDEHYRQLKP